MKFFRDWFTHACAICAVLAPLGSAQATPLVDVPAASVASPQPLGTSVKLFFSATDTDPGTLSYRLDVGPAGGSTLTMVRDFSVDPTFIYTPTRQEGAYQFVLTARNNSTGNTGTNRIARYRFTSLVTGGVAVVTPTAHPLVALLSTPPCPAGATQVRASILQDGLGTPSYTNWQACRSGQNVNILVAGMRASTGYTITSQTWNGTKVTSGTALPFTTGAISVSLPSVSVVTPLGPQDNQTQRFILLSTIAATPMAVDLGAHPVWYYVDPSGTAPLLYRPLLGGQITMLANGVNSAGNGVVNGQILREIDLAGNTLRETNATRIAEQVSALSGIPSSCHIGGTECLAGAFHHDAILLPNGHTLVLTDEEKIFTDGTQGSSVPNPVDIIGDLIVDLDANWQVVGYWRAFDHLDVNRAAVLGETCTSNAGGCPPIYLTAGIAKDWLHGNALYYSASDGSVLFSIRHQDWVVKIDYANGTGTGDIVWKLGAGGDFAMNSDDPFPWFSHQHDPGFVQNGTTTLALFDNGNTRVAPPPLGLGSGNSRGYVLHVDQVNHTATPVLLADLGFYSGALGTAELLSNGDYHFDAGYSPVTGQAYAQSIEVHPDATLGYTLQVQGVRCYRTFRMVSLYSPPSKD